MELATRCFACAEAHHEQAGITVYKPVRPGYEQAVAAARAAPGVEQSEALWGARPAMSLAEAVDPIATLLVDEP